MAYMHSEDNSIRITHKEFVSNITATTDFSIDKFAVILVYHPVFHFLSSLAQNYEQYIIHGMVWYYKSESAASLPIVLN